MDPASVLGVGPTFWFRPDERVRNYEAKPTGAINNKIMKASIEDEMSRWDG